MKRTSFLLVLITLLPIKALSQNEVLLTIDNQPVQRSEFERIYRKNNHVQGYESKAPAEYLDMFINFKLKVLEAKKLGFDTLPSFVNELAGYREQLSKPYLQDRNLIDQLVQEAYFRTVNEVNVSHIMVRLLSNASPADTFLAYNSAMDIRKRLLAGESFEKLALEESDDPSGKVNAGQLGWFSAFAMVYPFENAAYQTKTGDFSMPVRSKYGYHIIRVNGKRPALGEIKLAHIMIRAGSKDNPQAASQAKEKINVCYKLLQNGTSFSDVVKQYSEDAGSVRNGGQMRWLRSGELPPGIEVEVFALSDSGAYTRPLQSDFGWHIFQLHGKRPIASFDESKSQIEERIMMDERGKHTAASFLATLKKEYNFRSYPENVSMIASMLDSSVYSGNWDPSVEGNLIEPVFAIISREYSQKELAEYIAKTKRYNKKEDYASIIRTKCDELIYKELLNYEKNQLEEKYPDFKYLMEEYHDGILLFNIMDNNVWSKAVNDTTGLKAYYAQHVNDYRWQERADVSIYTLKDQALQKSVTKLAKKRAKSHWTIAEFVKMVCPVDTIACVAVSDHLFEKGENLPLGGFEWKSGFTKAAQEGNAIRLLVVNAILPPITKGYDEIQGQVTADYQNLLDQQWIEALRAKYPVVVNADVLKLVK